MWWFSVLWKAGRLPPEQGAPSTLPATRNYNVQICNPCFRILVASFRNCDIQTCRVQNPDIQRAGRVGRRTAGRRGGVGQNSSPRRQASLVPSKAPKTRCLNVPPEARTSEIVCKPMGEQSPLLTTGLYAVHLRFISGTRSALCSWLLTSGPMLICPCKPFSCKACPGI